MDSVSANLYPLLKQVVGYIYPNEIELHWNLLIVVYPISRASWRALSFSPRS